jgi:hypothetical protein
VASAVADVAARGDVVEVPEEPTVERAALG